MADNFLERQRQSYEERKQQWLKNKKHLTKIKRPRPKKPEDEALYINIAKAETILQVSALSPDLHKYNYEKTLFNPPSDGIKYRFLCNRKDRLT